MKYNEAEQAMRELEDEFPTSQVRIDSFADSEGHRDYGASVEIQEPAKLGEVARLEKISEKVGVPGALTGTQPGIVQIAFR